MNPNKQELIYRKKYAIQNLKEIKDACDKHNVPFWLSGGTLLGFCRNGNFLDHDTDIDIGVYSKDLIPEVLVELKKTGWHVEILGYPKSCFSIRATLRQIHVDFCIHHPLDENTLKYSVYVPYEESKQQYYYTSPNFELKEVDFLGMKVNIPSPPEQWLEVYYGTNWKIEDKNWFCFEDCTNLNRDFITINPNDELLEIKNWLGEIKFVKGNRGYDLD
jgi:fukutin